MTIKPGALALNAHVEKAADWPQRVILMTHGTLAHNKMEIMSSLQSLLKQRGYSSLSINLSYAIDNRASAMYDCSTPLRHKHTDALDEIGAWLGWLKQQGAKDLTLLGHSRGGNQTAWFAAERDDAIMQRVVLIAPATWNADNVAKNYKANNGKELAPLIAKAAAQKPDTLLPHTDLLYCKDTNVSAASFVSYYKPEPRFDTPVLLPKISKPVLVFAGTEDAVVPDVAQKFGPLADGKKVQLKTITGADHFFLDLYIIDAADVIAAFIGGK
ncbi:MAG: alpha/beta hydrolase [Gammaproteobacteria bacterium]|nr:alpha/beta hydrolase [Gammaproteobacteria bacterium]